MARLLDPLMIAVAGLLATAPAAHAAEGRVDVNEGWTLSVRSAPSASASQLGSLQDGTRVTIVCQARGERMTGTFGTSTLWDRLATGGYVSDTYVYTGSDGQVAPTCSSSSPTPAPPLPAPPPPEAPSAPASVTLRDDYPYAGSSWSRVDPWRFYRRECTSFVAFRLNKVMAFSNTMRGGRFGNAHNWDDNAVRLGYRVNRTPAAGAVMVRNSGRFGHVAIVARVGGDGKFLVEQYNAGGTHRYSQAWMTNRGHLRFIHF